MTKTILFSVFVLAAFLPCAALAAGNSSCAISPSQGNVCPPPHGGMVKGGIDNYYCGPGQCLQDNYGKIKCSSKPGGSAMFSSSGSIICVGGCVDGNKALCVSPF